MSPVPASSDHSADAETRQGREAGGLPADQITECGGDGGSPASVQLISPREVPLGGLRAMTVRRTIPARERSLVGAWCFLDHYGPDHVAETGGMAVARHPHTGLATVSWLFAGAVDHLDSGGNSARVVPGELNLMSAGRGITHSEFTTEDTDVLHGVQLWFAFPRIMPGTGNRGSITTVRSP